MRLFTRNGHDWSYRFPFIVQGSGASAPSCRAFSGGTRCPARSAASPGRVFRPFHSRRQFLWLVDRLIGELAAQTANPPVAVQPVIGRAVTVKG